MALWPHLAHVFGRPGEGLHAARVPGTNSAAVDFVGSLLLAWALGAATGLRLTLATLAIMAAAELLHWAFGVRVAARD